jgi:hypothetical protein
MNPPVAVSCSSAVSSLNPSILRDDAGDDLFTISHQFGLPESEHSANSACSSDLPQLHYQPTGKGSVGTWQYAFMIVT